MDCSRDAARARADFGPGVRAIPGAFTEKTQLTMIAARAGLLMDPGSKVTYNGVQIGRVGKIAETVRDGKPAAKFTLEVYPQYLTLIRRM